jgi:hypothetical protein
MRAVNSEPPPEGEDGWAAVQADAARQAAAVIEAFDSPAVMEAHERACIAMAIFAQALSDRGVTPTQVLLQLQGAGVSVWSAGMRL